jgi:PAS domain S-box-containing protein
MRMESLTAAQRRFFDRLGNPWDLSQLFDCLPDTYFYAKNVRGQFMMVNEALASMVGVVGPEAMIGKTDLDFAPRDLAEQYMAEDRRVMQTRKAVINQAWLVSDHRGVLKWYLSSKIPLLGRDGKVVGIAGAMRDVEKASNLFVPYRKMEKVLAFLFTRYAEKIDYHHLASLASLSISQLDRTFKRLFQLTPQQFVLRVRINAACQMLSATDQSVLDVALRNGFCDQSYFTKQFRRHLGTTPIAYRRKYRRQETQAGLTDACG